MKFAGVQSVAAIVALVSTVAASASPRSLYTVLGVSKDATEDEIKRAYRKQSLLYHPDKNSDPGAKDKFLEIAEAYEILSDKTKRDAYDRTGMRGTGSQGMSEDEAMRMFMSFMDQFEDILAGDQLSDFVDGLWGSRSRAKQGWLEWGLKSALKRLAKSAGGALLDNIKSGNIELTVGGEKMEFASRKQEHPQGRAGEAQSAKTSRARHKKESADEGSKAEL